MTRESPHGLRRRAVLQAALPAFTFGAFAARAQTP